MSATCPDCRKPYADPMADEFDDDTLPVVCGDGCGRTMCGHCRAEHSSDCFESHLSLTPEYRARGEM